MVDEHDLIAAARRGDHTAQAELIERHQRRVFRLALQVCGNAHDAEDIAQDALVKALTGLADFRGDAKFSTWLYRITYTTALTFVQRRRDTGDIDGLEVAAANATDESALTGELGAAIRAAMAELSPRQRECFRLQYFEELKISEIAAVTGIEPGSVKQHLFRGAATLRRKLAHFSEVRS
ncbi:MAG TPA: RNA polymerase sigma factor [bacterium]|nr:RNA polymerase sigma factor [bacterium]